MLKNAAIVPYIPVSNVARAREFYEKKVGLQPKEEYAGGVVYECANGSFVFMYPTPNAGTNKASTAFWSVQDVEKEVADLKGRGVVFEAHRCAIAQSRVFARPRRGRGHAPAA